MDRREMRPPVLARIPNLSSSRAERPPEEPPTSGGRIINQAFSWKLLASVALVLVALAIVPLSSKRDAASSDPTAAAEAWNPSAPTPAPAAEVASPWTTPVAMAPTSPAPVANTAFEPLADGVKPASASIAEPLVSAWPNAPQSTWPKPATAEEQPQADANQSMAVRPGDRTNY
jgi:hypothetical protein